MIDAAVIAALVLAVVVLGYVYRRGKNRPGEDLETRLEDALEAELGPGLATHLDEPIALKRLAVLDRRGGEPVYVPVVHVPLGTTDAPKPKLVFEYIADVLEVVHPVLEDEHVSHYDVQFSFGPGGLLVSGECRRVAVPPAMAARLCTEPTYRAHELRRDVEAGDGEGGLAPVAWGPCRSYD